MEIKQGENIMASDTFKTILVGLVLFVLFTSLILTVAVDFGAEYDRDASEIGGGSLNLSVFQSSAEDVESTASAYRRRFESGEVSDVDNPSGVFSIVTDMINIITTPFKLLSQVLSNIFHVPTLFINVVLGLLSITLILAIWSLLKKGD
jgi:hypothetical protein